MFEAFIGQRLEITLYDTVHRYILKIQGPRLTYCHLLKDTDNVKYLQSIKTCDSTQDSTM